MHRPQPQAVPPGAVTPPSAGVLLLAPRPNSRISASIAQRVQSEATELAHDARNLISALHLYCELLAAPGVLAPGFGHYADDLRRVASGAARLIEALAGPGRRPSSHHTYSGRSRDFGQTALRHRPFPGIDDLASELMALEGPLQSLAGPGVRVEVECAPCAGRLALTSEDLLRILFNLLANAVEALASLPPELPRTPLVRITAQRGGAASFLNRRAQEDGAADSAETVVLSVRDNGPGIAAEHLPHIFTAGFSTRGDAGLPPRIAAGEDSDCDGAEQRAEDSARGLGLSIVARLVSSAGGAVRGVSPSGLGTRFDIELPIFPAFPIQGPHPATRLDFADSGSAAKINNLQQISAQREKEA